MASLHNQKELFDKLVALYNEIEGVKLDIAAVKENSEKGLEKADISLVDKAAKVHVADKFSDQKGKWDLFEDTYITLTE